MAVSHVNTDATADIASATATVTVTKPTGAASTDVCVVVFGTDKGNNTAQTITPPAGVTRVGVQVTQTNGASQIVNLDAFWFLGSQTSLGFTNSATGAAVQQGWVCASFRGVDNTTPIDVADGTGNKSTGVGSLTVNAVTVATDQAWDMMVAADWKGFSLSSTGFTASQNASANASACLLYNTTPKSIGSTGTASLVAATDNTATEIKTALRFALRPAASAAGTPGGVLIARQEPHWSQIYEKWAGRRSPGIYPEPATLSRRGRRQRRSYEESLRRSPVRLAA